MPAKRIIVNLAPADLPKEGSHYDLAIALALMAAIEAVPSRCAAGHGRDRGTVSGWAAGADIRRFTRRNGCREPMS